MLNYNFRSIVAKALSYNPISAISLHLFKKRISFNHITIRTIAFILGQRILFQGVTIDVSDNVITPLTKALLYWDNYEKAEIDLVKKHLLDNDDVIELGSSIGVLGSVISQIQKTGKYISVEADPRLINANKRNLEINRSNKYVLLNKAVDYNNISVSFSNTDSTLRGKIDRYNLDTSKTRIETITLNEICVTYNFIEYTLISDIEGAEITLLLYDETALRKCKKIIIELHNTKYAGQDYSIQNMLDKFYGLGFSLIDKINNVFVLSKM